MAQIGGMATNLMICFYDNSMIIFTQLRQSNLAYWLRARQDTIP